MDGRSGHPGGHLPAMAELEVETLAFAVKYVDNNVGGLSCRLELT
jgi:hypothetical protein